MESMRFREKDFKSRNALCVVTKGVPQFLQFRPSVVFKIVAWYGMKHSQFLHLANLSYFSALTIMASCNALKML